MQDFNQMFSKLTGFINGLAVDRVTVVEMIDDRTVKVSLKEPARDFLVERFNALFGRPVGWATTDDPNVLVEEGDPGAVGPVWCYQPDGGDAIYGLYVSMMSDKEAVFEIADI